MRYLIASLALLALSARADVGLDAAVVFGGELGYSNPGYGIQLDMDGRSGDWGWDATGAVFRHSKIGATGNRYEVRALGRRHFGNKFVEAGVQWGGYESSFADGTVWEKYGYSPGVGFGVTQGPHEATLRYWHKDTTPNNTAMVVAAYERKLAGNWVMGLSLEVWQFDQSGERKTGRQSVIEFGWRF